MFLGLAQQDQGRNSAMLENDIILWKGEHIKYGKRMTVFGEKFYYSFRICLKSEDDEVYSQIFQVMTAF